MDNQHLLDEFQNEVIELCETTKRDTSYNPKGFRGKVLRVGHTKQLQIYWIQLVIIGVVLRS